jgi:hypothetical protein
MLPPVHRKQNSTTKDTKMHKEKLNCPYSLPAVLSASVSPW